MIKTGFGEPELLDDLNDHWTSECHKKEREELIARLQKFAKEKNIRVTFLSGDVHVGGVAMFKCNASNPVYPDKDYRLMYQIISSAVGNVPPPPVILKQLHLSSAKLQFDPHTDEKMYHVFQTGLQGEPLSEQYLMGARNWCSITSPYNHDLIFDLRMEKSQGEINGDTKSYFVYVPPLLLNQ
jgi:hypothetical protein